MSLTDFAHCSGVSIVDFEEVNAGWAAPAKHWEPVEPLEIPCVMFIFLIALSVPNLL